MAMNFLTYFASSSRRCFFAMWPPIALVGRVWKETQYDRLRFPLTHPARIGTFRSYPCPFPNRRAEPRVCADGRSRGFLLHGHGCHDNSGREVPMAQRAQPDPDNNTPP